ncbi:MAG: 1-(5-phosphoribosyl)-5-[(5-phosphoribosylamino)methylideneamino]imidazole-4-carboxamide isomerase [Chloroflexota bacterium]|nr:1-(5-phosphoribosyl)-5-[(5-phosphoribosylamino)methylideneamino]imidazole-4-carboxamide isomerase [Chloroflexota bacterium]
MIVYPAIDLRGGRCVRLQQGDAGAETVFADDPAEAARRWAAEEAEWLHVVNLDGALGESGAANLVALERIMEAVDLPIQFGGGLRSLEDVERLLDMGVARVILGTVAVRDPQIVEQAVAAHGAQRVIVGIDARDGLVAIHGWVDTSDVQAVALARRMRDVGIERVVYTDVRRDGMLTGVNVAATVELARASRLRVIASGGVSSLDDIRALKAHEKEGVEGVIIGMALYRGEIELAQAQELAAAERTD